MIGNDIIGVLDAGLDACLSPESCEYKTQLARTEGLGRLHGYSGRITL